MKLFIYIISSLIIFITATLIFYPTPPLLEGIQFSTAIYDNQHNLLRITTTTDGKYRLQADLDHVSPKIIQATLLEEDQHFFQHIGINPLSLLKAAWQTYVLHHRRRGGSTLSMQVARIRFNIPSHTLIGKIKQIFIALLLEYHYSKREILNAYLNLAPYGNNIEGIAAASLIYYHQSAATLNLSQALTLTVIPQNPTRRSPNLPKNLALKSARDNLFSRWLENHPADKLQQAIIKLPLQVYTLRNLPFLAPHFVDQIIANDPHAHSIVTTLDERYQRVLEHTLGNYLQQQKKLGINNAAALLLDSNTMAVTALIGSADFYNKNIQGQVNGTTAKRSPGSALKPFVYALALDQGLIHPATILKDAPTSFGNYNPENFDYDFLGPIKASDALILSRNIPALYLANKLSHPTLYEFLQQADISGLKPARAYGLTLVLGGAEVTMEELVRLYAMLNNQGWYKNLRTRVDQPLETGKRLLSPEASFITLDMLQNNPRPDELFLSAIVNNKLAVAWKTGTSSRYRDAWSIGIFSHYVLAVWIGNFDGTPNPAFIGKEAAAPLLFAMIDDLNDQLGPLPAHQVNLAKLHLTQIDVCDASGMLPTRNCPVTRKTWFIPGKSPITTDTVFREVMIDSRTGLRACHFDPHNKFVVYEFWPSDLLQLFKRAGLERRTPPAFDPSCNLTSQGMMGLNPHIATPQADYIYSMRLHDHKIYRIAFSAISDADVQNLYWFVNASFVGKSARGSAFLWKAKPGSYVVRVVDDFGRSDATDLKVQLIN